MTALRTERARTLRRNATDVEAKLWGALRGRQLAGLKWRRQLPVDRYFADFGCKEARLIVELDGDQHLQQAGYDEARTAEMERCGWQVIRFANGEVRDDLENVLKRILDEVQTARGCLPSPSHSASPSGPLPLPRTGEEKKVPNHD